MTGTIGVITCFAGPFIPSYYLPCNGQSLSVNQNLALFSILSNVYGGDGVTTFNLPDLRGRAPVSPGQNGNGRNYNPGQSAGTESILLSPLQLPSHSHNGDITLQLAASSDDGIDYGPNDQYPARFTGAYSAIADSYMLASTYGFTIGYTGAGTPLDTRSPFLVLNYIICVAGTYPSKG